MPKIINRNAMINSITYRVEDLHTFLFNSKSYKTIPFPLHFSTNLLIKVFLHLNSCSLANCQHHMIHHIHVNVHMYLGFQINPSSTYLYQSILYIHICIYRYSNTVYCYKHLHLIYSYMHKFYALI